MYLKVRVSGKCSVYYKGRELIFFKKDDNPGVFLASAIFFFFFFKRFFHCLNVFVLIFSCVFLMCRKEVNE